MRLIDADVLLDIIPYCDANCTTQISKVGAIADMIMLVSEAPTIDAVPVVRCKDCVNYCGFDHCKNGICDVDSVSKRAVYPGDFCSYGERRSDD